ncbi:MAG: hypothetical protein JSV44_09450, partial [Candidatus Zixiibacteriota bacterium]
VLEEPAKSVQEADDILSLVRILEDRREHEAIASLAGGFEMALREQGRLDVLMRLALAYKRTSQTAKAVAIWQHVAERQTAESQSAWVELAKYYEHRAKNIPAALEHALRAEAVCAELPSALTEVQKRIRRLRRKLTI